MKGSEEQKGTDTNTHVHPCSQNWGSRTKYRKSHIRDAKGFSAGHKAVTKMLGARLVQRNGLCSTARISFRSVGISQMP